MGLAMSTIEQSYVNSMYGKIRNILTDFPFDISVPEDKLLVKTIMGKICDWYGVEKPKVVYHKDSYSDNKRACELNAAAWYEPENKTVYMCSDSTGAYYFIHELIHHIRFMRGHEGEKTRGIHEQAFKKFFLRAYMLVRKDLQKYHTGSLPEVRFT